MNSRSASSAPAALARLSPAPTAPRGFVVRSQSAAMPPVARITARAETVQRRRRRASGAASPTQRPSCVAIAVAASGSSTSTRSCVAASAESARVIRRPVAAPPACTIRRSRVAALEPEREVAVAVGVEADAELAEGRARASGDSSHSTRTALSRAASRPAASVSSACRVGRVVRRPARRRSRPAPSSSRSARAASGSPARRSPPGRRPRAPRRGRRRRRQPLRRRCGEARSRRAPRYRTGAHAAVLPTTRLARARHRPRPSGAADRIRAIEAELESRDWLGWERARGARGHRGAAAARAPGRSTSTRVREHERARRGVRPGHAHQPGLLRGGAARRGRRLRARGVAAHRRRARRASRRCGRPGHHAERARGDGLLPVRERGDRGAPRARLARCRAGAGARLGRAPRQRHQRDLPRLAARCCS